MNMSFFNLLMVGLAVSGCFFLLAAFAFWYVSSENITFYERLSRNRVVGVIIAAGALAWCVPQAEALAWDFLSRKLWLLAGGFTLAAYFFLDFLFSRAIGGLMILAAYYFLRESFAYDIHGAVPGAIIAWSIGLIGIIFSAKPCLLRDWFRLAAKKSSVKYLSTIYFLLVAGYSWVAFILNVGGWNGNSL